VNTTNQYDVRGDLDLDGDADSNDKTALRDKYEGVTLGRQALSSPANGNSRGLLGLAIAPVGVAHARNRDFILRQGTWASRDPAGYADGMNLYAVLGANPIHYLDPLGLECEVGFRDNSTAILHRNIWFHLVWVASAMDSVVEDGACLGGKPKDPCVVDMPVTLRVVEINRSDRLNNPGQFVLDVPGNPGMPHWWGRRLLTWGALPWDSQPTGPGGLMVHTWDIPQPGDSASFRLEEELECGKSGHYAIGVTPKLNIKVWDGGDVLPYVHSPEHTIQYTVHVDCAGCGSSKAPPAVTPNPPIDPGEPGPPAPKGGHPVPASSTPRPAPGGSPGGGGGPKTPGPGFPGAPGAQGNPSSGASVNSHGGN
jgi:RHS repeat-associated protein